MSAPIYNRPMMGDAFARGFDIFRLQAALQARSIALMAKVLGAIGAMGIAAWLWLVLPQQVLLGAGRYAFAYVASGFIGGDLQGIPVLTDTGWQSWPTTRILNDAWHEQAFTMTLNSLAAASIVFILLSGPLAFVIFLAARRRGRYATADLLARGQRVVDDRELHRIVRATTRVSRFAIGHVAMPEAVLNRSFVALGTPGTGKSVLIKRWLREIQRRGDMAVVFDKVGDFTAEFYDPERGDVLLNPLDARSPPWSPWAEMRQIADAYRIAKSLIPSIQGDNNFFHIAAQDLFATLLTRIWTLRNRSLLGLLEAALVWDKEAKAELLKGTSAAKHYMGEHRSGHDVDATASVYTQALRFLPITSGGPGDFSIRDFITDTVNRRETDPREAWATQKSRFEREYEGAVAARKLLAIGDLRRARELVSRAALVFPLLPQGMSAPSDPAVFADWWKTVNDEIEQHWRAQDEERPSLLRALEAKHRAAAERLKKRGAPWLFIASDQRQLQAVRPVLSLWLDAVADTIMSLPPDDQRRIWFILDELQALQELPSLQPLLTEGRKYGACVVAGVQNMGQLRQNYGPDRAEVLLSLLNTKAFFRLPEPRTAKWCEDAIGSAVMERVGESIRYGTSETMDGAQLSPHRSTEPIVMAGDIARQPDLHCYLTLPGNWPVGRIQLGFDARRDAPPPRAKPLIPRPQKDTIFAALDQKGWRPIPEQDDPAATGAVARTLAAAPEDDQRDPRDQGAARPRAERDRPSGASEAPDGAARLRRADGPAAARNPAQAAPAETGGGGRDARLDASPPAQPVAPSSDPTPPDMPKPETVPRPPVGDLARAATPTGPAGAPRRGSAPPPGQQPTLFGDDRRTPLPPAPKSDPT
jgi:hypothetical protein